MHVAAEDTVAHSAGPAADRVVGIRAAAAAVDEQGAAGRKAGFEAPGRWSRSDLRKTPSEERR